MRPTEKVKTFSYYFVPVYSESLDPSLQILDTAGKYQELHPKQWKLYLWQKVFSWLWMRHRFTDVPIIPVFLERTQVWCFSFLLLEQIDCHGENFMGGEKDSNRLFRRRAGVGEQGRGGKFQLQTWMSVLDPTQFWPLLLPYSFWRYQRPEVTQRPSWKPDIYPLLIPSYVLVWHSFIA